MNAVRLESIRSTIDRADSVYYRPGCKPIMTDGEYDALKAELRAACPDDVRLSRVGVPYSPDELGTKRPHKIPMGSLDNTDKGILGFSDWYDKMTKKLGNAPAVYGTLKIDGNSVVADYDDDGKLVSITSRGNGEVGEDITANATMFHGLPTQLPVKLSCSVRGEAVLPSAAFATLTAHIPPDKLTNARNLAAGIIGRSSGEDSSLIHFIAFHIEFHRAAGVPNTVHGLFDFMKALGFEVAPGRLCHGPDDFERFYFESLGGRATLPYGVDGTVVALDAVDAQNKFVTKDPKTRLRPKYARAVKFPEYSATTTLTGLNVTVGHTGSIIPTACLEPVRIAGLPGVKSALLTNYDEVMRLGVAIGDEVEVVLAGDIIPRISKKVPKYRCPECGFTGTEAQQIEHHSTT